MNGFTKLFGSIIHSTIWQEPHTVRVLWVTMLAMADQDGMVAATIPGLAHAAHITIPECEIALHKFQQPDKYSKSPVEEGRRIRPVDGGWQLINYLFYRDLMSPEDQKEKNRLRQQAFRDRRNAKRNVVALRVTPSNKSNDIAEAEAEAEADKSKASRFAPPTLEEVTAFCRERNNDVDPVKFHAHYECQGWYAGPRKMKSWRSAVIKWERNNFGGPFRDGYQKTGRAERQQLGTQQQRALGNATAIFGLAAEMGPDSSPDGPGQETRPDGRSYALLAGKVKTIP